MWDGVRAEHIHRLNCGKSGNPKQRSICDNHQSRARLPQTHTYYIYNEREEIFLLSVKLSYMGLQYLSPNKRCICWTGRWHIAIFETFGATPALWVDCAAKSNWKTQRSEHIDTAGIGSQLGIRCLSAKHSKTISKNFLFVISSKHLNCGVLTACECLCLQSYS